MLGQCAIAMIFEDYELFPHVILPVINCGDPAGRFSRSRMKNSHTNAQLRAIAYTDNKRSASHLATAAKLYTCMSLIKHIFFQESH